MPETHFCHGVGSYLSKLGGLFSWPKLELQCQFGGFLTQQIWIGPLVFMQNPIGDTVFVSAISGQCVCVNCRPVVGFRQLDFCARWFDKRFGHSQGAGAYFKLVNQFEVCFH